jgi:starch phosphorylase
MLREWINLFHDLRARMHVVFLTDYDMLVTQNLVRGVDLWINTPRRPWEACGTSGMKILPNGGLNLSELDGWWVEAYKKELGWALGDGKEHDSDPDWDTKDALQLYDLLEKEIVPAFYTRDSDGLPTAWIARIRESMAQLTPRFSADRAVRDYTEQHYLPAATRYRQRTIDQGAFGKKWNEWQNKLLQHWYKMRFEEVKIETKGNEHLFEVRVYLDDLAPSAVELQLYAEGGSGEAPYCQTMKRARELPSSAHTHIYTASAPAKIPAQNYTPRILPHFEGVQTPLEIDLILWQK